MLDDELLILELACMIDMSSSPGDGATLVV
jgi:hypothetical protein